MNRTLFVLLIMGVLLFSGCCSYLTPEQSTGGYTQQPAETKPMITISFCNSLTTQEIQSTCLQNWAGKIQDDQRLRDYLTYWDTVLKDAKDLDAIAQDLEASGNAWNAADTTEERTSAYRSYSVSAQEYATKLETTTTHLTNFQTFISQNKAYFDSQGVNSVQQINFIITTKGDLKSTTYGIQSNLELMGQSLALEGQAKQQNDALIQTLLQLAVGLI